MAVMLHSSLDCYILLHLSRVLSFYPVVLYAGECLLQLADHAAAVTAAYESDRGVLKAELQASSPVQPDHARHGPAPGLAVSGASVGQS